MTRSLHLLDEVAEAAGRGPGELLFRTLVTLTKIAAVVSQHRPVVLASPRKATAELQEEQLRLDALLVLRQVIGCLCSAIRHRCCSYCAG
jgi:hypothetical protein